jgi:putative mRNA 3-end processing factor
MHMLAPTELPVQIHGAGYKFCEVYEEAGIDLGNYESYNRDTCKDKVLVTTNSAINNGFASNVTSKKLAYCSGWATRESSRSQLTVHKLIPLSDHLDFFELINLCKKLNPKKVHITHTPNASVVQHYLNELNIESRFLDLEAENND